MMKADKNCQSCGMPLKRDEQGGGTDADGTRSTVYCSHCYQRGQFVLPDLTATQMQARVSEKLAEFGIPRFLHCFFTCAIPKLARWQPPANPDGARNRSPSPQNSPPKNDMKKPMTLTTIALAALLGLSGCVASIGNRDARLGNGTLGQQLIDLQKAKEAGAISEAEYQTQKARLLDHR